MSSKRSGDTNPDGKLLQEFSQGCRGAQGKWRLLPARRKGYFCLTINQPWSSGLEVHAFTDAAECGRQEPPKAHYNRSCDDFCRAGSDDNMRRRNGGREASAAQCKSERAISRTTQCEITVSGPTAGAVLARKKAVNLSHRFRT